MRHGVLPLRGNLRRGHRVARASACSAGFSRRLTSPRPASRGTPTTPRCLNSKSVKTPLVRSRRPLLASGMAGPSADSCNPVSQRPFLDDGWRRVLDLQPAASGRRRSFRRRIALRRALLRRPHCGGADGILISIDAGRATWKHTGFLYPDRVCDLSCDLDIATARAGLPVVFATRPTTLRGQGSNPE